VAVNILHSVSDHRIDFGTNAGSYHLIMHEISSYFIKATQEVRGALKLVLSNIKKDDTKSVLFPSLV
jgi:hypothetical protein